MSLDLAAVMTEVGDLLKKIAGLRVFDYEAASTIGETIFVAFPGEVTYNQEYGPDGWRLDLPLVLVVPNPGSRNTRDKLAKYTSTIGDYSIKLALESPAEFDDEWTSYTSFDFANVKNAAFDEVTMNNNTYSGVLFTVDIAGS